MEPSSPPIAVFNATFHEPSEEQREAGVGPPRGEEVPVGANYEDIRILASSLLDEAEQNEADAVLIGGLSSVAIAVFAEATNRGLGVVEAVTERQADVNDRFTFRHHGFRVLAEPDAEVVSPETWNTWRAEHAPSVNSDST